MKIDDLKKQYETVCVAYIKKFCQKQGLKFDFWVADEVGSVASVSDYYFNFSDIVWDVNSKQPKGLILEWYNECVEHAGKAINYFSYTQGLRVKDIQQ